MSYTNITAHIIDQSIQLANLPLLASGGIEEVKITCSFCSLWTGFGKEAVFYRKDGQVYHIPLAGGEVVIPWEVMAEPGVVYFGIMGTDGTTTRTTEVLRLSIEQGALTAATAEHENPAPDIYEQILAAYGKVDDRIDIETAARKAEVAVERARIDEIVAMRHTEGVTVFEMTANGLTGTITTNGAAAFVECVPNFTLPKGEYANFYIPAYLTPMVPVEIPYNHDISGAITCTVRVEGSTGRPMISFYNSNALGNIKLENIPAIGSYSLANLSLSELADARVGADGVTYPTAGDANRAQFNKTNNGLQQFANAFSSGVSGEMVSFNDASEGPAVSVVTNISTETSGCVLTRCGKNLAPVNDFTVYQASVPAGLKGLYFPAGTYTFSAQKVENTLSGSPPMIFIRDTAGTTTPIGATALTAGKSLTLAAPWTVFSVYSTSSGSANAGQSATFTGFQIELGASATSYEAYQGEEWSAEFPVAVLEGSYDWLSGVLTDVGNGKEYQLDRAAPIMLASTNSLYSRTDANIHTTEVRYAYDIAEKLENVSKAGSAVLFTAQMLTEAQKAQARQNIGVEDLEPQMETLEAKVDGVTTRLGAIDSYMPYTAEYASIPQGFQSKDTYTLCITADSHFDRTGASVATHINACRDARALEDYLHCDAFLHLGDILTLGYTTVDTPKASLAEYARHWYDGHKKPVFMLRGNHDDNSYGVKNGGTQTVNTNPAALISKKMWHNMVTRMAYPDAVLPSGVGTDPYANYFYYDSERTKIRLICLDTIDYPEIKDGNAMRYTAYTASAISNEQLQFIAQALDFSDKENPSDWAVIIASHIPLDTSKEAGKRMGITDMRICGCEAFFGILNAYRDGTSYTASGDDWQKAHAANKQAGDFAFSVSVDFTAQGPGEVICLLAGHTHTDNTSNEVGAEGGLSWGYRFITTAASGYANMVVDREDRTIYMTKRAKQNGYVLTDANNPGVIAGLTVGGSAEYANVDADGVYKVTY